MNSKSSYVPVSNFVVAGFFSVVAVALNLYMGSLREQLVSGAIGAGLFPLIFSGIVVGLFQVMPRFRNRRSRWRIYTWTIGVLALIAIVQALPTILTGGFLVY